MKKKRKIEKNVREVNEMQISLPRRSLIKFEGEKAIDEKGGTISEGFTGGMLF
jgi:hypothetical protein